jgi:threonine/homoserine/homoserine lactone efflux protein
MVNMLLLGMAIGFYGYLQPGIINTMMLQLYLHQEIRKLLIAFICCIFFEIIYASISLYIFTKYTLTPTTQLYFKVAGAIIFIVIALSMLGKTKVYQQKQVLHKQYKQGIIAIILHPQQIPFWMATFSFVLPVLSSTNLQPMIWLLVGNTIGVILIMIIYVFVGSLFSRFILQHQKRINNITAYLLLAIAITNLILMLKNNYGKY